MHISNQQEQPRLNYSLHTNFQRRNSLFEIPHCCLRPVFVHKTIECFDINFHKAFFETSGDFPFDIFAASFYLLSRYEEYLPHEKDMYGRYAHTNSLAFREHFLITTPGQLLAAIV